MITDQRIAGLMGWSASRAHVTGVLGGGPDDLPARVRAVAQASAESVRVPKRSIDITETLIWMPVAMKPDSDITVLCWRRGIGEWFSGWYDDEACCWFDCATGDVVEGVTHWAHVEGPK